jgi:hypothetical protein
VWIVSDCLFYLAIQIPYRIFVGIKEGGLCKRGTLFQNFEFVIDYFFLVDEEVSTVRLEHILVLSIKITLILYK